MKCLNCDTEFIGTARAKFCSDKCRVQFNRNNRSVTKPHVTEKSVTENDTEKLTSTDRLFADHQPGYYTFSDKVYERTCLMPECSKKFKTSLQLLKFCSPEHQIEVLDRLSGKYADKGVVHARN